MQKLGMAFRCDAAFADAHLHRVAWHEVNERKSKQSDSEKGRNHQAARA